MRLQNLSVFQFTALFHFELQFQWRGLKRKGITEHERYIYLDDSGDGSSSGSGQNHRGKWTRNVLLYIYSKNRYYWTMTMATTTKNITTHNKCHEIFSGSISNCIYFINIYGYIQTSTFRANKLYFIANENNKKHTHSHSAMPLFFLSISVFSRVLLFVFLPFYSFSNVVLFQTFFTPFLLPNNAMKLYQCSLTFFFYCCYIVSVEFVANWRLLFSFLWLLFGSLSFRFVR